MKFLDLKRWKEGVISGLIITVIWAVIGLETLLSAPALEQLEYFEGVVSELKMKGSSERIWEISIVNPYSDRRVFSVIERQCLDIGEKINIGDKLKVSLYRPAGWFGDYSAWQIATPAEIIVSYKSSVENHAERHSWGLLGLLIFFMLFFLIGIYVPPESKS